MDGLLLLDKPAGPTSHDVVARIRRVLHERQIGHTGTLDPAATGLLALVIGRATRLARFMTAADKSYDAVVRLGLRTDSADLDGQTIGEPYDGPLPSRDAIERALVPLRGTYPQQPPAFSAKKIAGRRSYAIAREARARGEQIDDAETARLPAPVTVVASAIELLALDGHTVTLRVDCSAGFYVRALARDLGERLGTGACLAALRRTRSGSFTLEKAVTLAAAEASPDAAREHVLPLAQLLPDFPAITLTADGLRLVAHGRDIMDVTGAADAPFVRLLDPAGQLAAVAERTERPGVLHPAVVLM